MRLRALCLFRGERGHRDTDHGRGRVEGLAEGADGGWRGVDPGAWGGEFAAFSVRKRPLLLGPGLIRPSPPPPSLGLGLCDEYPWACVCARPVRLALEPSSFLGGAASLVVLLFPTLPGRELGCSAALFRLGAGEMVGCPRPKPVKCLALFSCQDGGKRRVQKRNRNQRHSGNQTNPNP